MNKNFANELAKINFLAILIFVTFMCVFGGLTTAALHLWNLKMNPGFAIFGSLVFSWVGFFVAAEYHDTASAQLRQEFKKENAGRETPPAKTISTN